MEDTSAGSSLFESISSLIKLIFFTHFFYLVEQFDAKSNSSGVRKVGDDLLRQFGEMPNPDQQDRALPPITGRDPVKSVAGIVRKLLEPLIGTVLVEKT
jgi:hypothetical protein